MTSGATLIWPRRFWLARHGRTAMNLAGLVQGRLDPPLAPEGVADAERIARQLAGCGVRCIISSTLRRAMETGAIVAAHLGLPHHEDPRLAERDWGPWEGAAGHLRPQMADPPGAEPRAALKDRVVAAVSDAMAAGLGEDTLFVAHAGVCRTVLELVGLDVAAPVAHDRALLVETSAQRLRRATPSKRC